MSAHNLLSKVDRALVAYLISQNAGTADDVFPAKDSGDKHLNCTICWSERGVEDPPYSGTYVVTAQVQIRTLAAIDVNQDPEEPKALSEDRVAQTFDAFHVGIDSAGDKLADAITEAAHAAGITDFTVQNVSPGPITQGFDDQHARAMKGSAWVDAIELEILC